MPNINNRPFVPRTGCAKMATTCKQTADAPPPLSTPSVPTMFIFRQTQHSLGVVKRVTLIFLELQMEHVRTFTHGQHQLRHFHTHTNTLMPGGEEAAAAAGRKEVNLEADAARLCFGSISAHQILNHSLSSPVVFSLFLYDSLIIYFFISLPLTPPPLPSTLSPASLCLFLAGETERGACAVRGERSFISYGISGRGRVVSLCECFTISKLAASSWLQVEIFDLLCAEDFSANGAPGDFCFF